MRFAAPHILWLLLVIPPALAAFFWWAGRKKQALMARFIHARLLPQLTTGVSPGHRRLHLGSLIAATALLIVALARPQWGFIWEEVSMRGLDIVVAIDTSRSMLAQDIAPNRLARAKLAALDLLQQAASDRVGLVVFAGSAFLQCPLTVDDVAFRQSLDAVQVGIIPDGGTAIGPAIEAALTAYKEGDNHRVLVVFSDGEDHDSGAVEAARKAAEQGMKIYTIGLGSPEGELLRVTDEKGNSDYVRDEQGNVIKSRLNEDLLRQVAGATEGGFYLPLRGANTIEALYQQALAKLPKTDRQEKLVKRYYERFHWPLGVAVALLFFDWLFPEGPRANARETGGKGGAGRGLRAARRTSSRAAVLPLLVLLAVPAGGLAASPGGALREYNEGNYEQARRQYEQLLQKRKDDPRLHFNAGASAYREGDFDQAARHFSEAMNSPDLDLQRSAYYNRGNSYYYQGEEVPDPQKKQETWKKSLQDFQSALKLAPKDADATHNYDFVQRKLQELQQQQQQQQNQDKQDDSKEQDKNQQQQQNQQQQDKDQKQDQQQQQQQEQQQQSQEQQQQPKPGEEQQPQQQQGQEQEQQPGEKKQPNPGQPSGEEKEQQAASAQEQPSDPNKMTPQEARRLLDAAKNDEKLLPANPTNRPAASRRNIKDW